MQNYNGHRPPVHWLQVTGDQLRPANGLSQVFPPYGNVDYKLPATQMVPVNDKGEITSYKVDVDPASFDERKLQMAANDHAADALHNGPDLLQSLTNAEREEVAKAYMLGRIMPRISPRARRLLNSVMNTQQQPQPAQQQAKRPSLRSGAPGANAYRALEMAHMAVVAMQMNVPHRLVLAGVHLLDPQIEPPKPANGRWLEQDTQPKSQLQEPQPKRPADYINAAPGPNDKRRRPQLSGLKLAA
jgi:hypothetical protein